MKRLLTIAVLLAPATASAQAPARLVPGPARPGQPPVLPPAAEPTLTPAERRAADVRADQIHRMSKGLVETSPPKWNRLEKAIRDLRYAGLEASNPLESRRDEFLNQVPVRTDPEFQAQKRLVAELDAVLAKLEERLNTETPQARARIAARKAALAQFRRTNEANRLQLNAVVGGIHAQATAAGTAQNQAAAARGQDHVVGMRAGNQALQNAGMGGGLPPMGSTGPVHVNSYIRGDGTRVRAHNRNLPR